MTDWLREHAFNQTKEMERMRREHDELSFLARVMKSAGLTKLVLDPSAGLDKGESLKSHTDDDGRMVLEIKK